MDAFVVCGAMTMNLAVFGYPLDHLDLQAIDIGGEIGRRIDVTVRNNLLVLDLENDFVKPFRTQDRTEGFIGLGMLIDAATRLAYHTGDQEVIALKERLVEETLAIQEDDGYIGLMRQEARIRKLWDVHEMAYIVLGLSSEYDLFKNEKALAAARKLADYLIREIGQRPPPETFDSNLNPAMPITGLGDALLYLAEQSGDSKYREFCLEVLDVDSWRKPIVKGRWGPIDGHVYAYIDKCLLQLALDPDKKRPGLREASDTVLEFLLRRDGLTLSGACGDHECWHDTQSGMCNLGETCASVYLLKFYDELLRQTGEAIYGDLMERTLYNTLFAAQSPDGRRLRYYTPFEAPRVFFDRDTYCCPNNYRRGISDLPQYVIYRHRKGLWVNLYTPCTVRTSLWDGTEVRVAEKTAYPSDGDISLTLSMDRPKEFSLGLRIPGWCDQARVRVNGEAVRAKADPGSFCLIERTWRDGDVVELGLPMEWRLFKGRRSQAGRAAVMRGPQIFGVAPSRNPGVETMDLRLMTADIDSLEGPMADDSVRPGGMACTIGAWDPGTFYPGRTSRTLTLTEFADPELQLIYLHVPDPEDDRLRDDELLAEPE